VCGLVDDDPLDPEPPAVPEASAERQAVIPDEAIWLILKIATVVFILIALVLVAESF
jgi:hypothetical protein